MFASSMKRPHRNFKGLDHRQYVARITKTLYYGKLPTTDRLSLPVSELAAELFSEAQCGKSLERLHLNTASNISRNACVSPCSLVLALLYLDRLKTCNAEYLERTNPSDLFLVSLMISSKYLFDDGESDEVFIDEWANSAGLTVTELVLLEREFLNAIEWEIYVKEISFWKKLHHLETELAKREGCQRGFFTYTELMNLFVFIDLYSLIQCVVTITMIFVASYTVGVLTIAGSFHLVSRIPGNALKHKNIEKPELAQLGSTVEFREDFINDTEILVKLGGRTVEPANILRTSIFLASINTFMGSYCNNSSNNEISQEEDETSWAWWNLPSMIWLSKRSEEIYKVGDYVKCFMKSFQLLAINSNCLVDGNHVNMNKATKTRIQDQMEVSWHQEWTDSLKQEFFYTPNVPNIKV